MADTMVRQETAAEFGRDHSLIHEVVITGRKVGAGRSFWSRLAHEKTLFAKTVLFVERGGEETITSLLLSRGAESAAISILGANKVLTRAQAHGGMQEFPICYSVDTLCACAKENVEQGRNWRLVYLRGNSLREERERVGWDQERQPCFDPNCTWWLDESENGWATERFEAGYYLLDFSRRFGRFASWLDQKKGIAKLGPEFELAHEAMITEAALRIFEATGERLLSNWYHRSNSLNSRGRRIHVGNFDLKGWYVSANDPPVCVGCDDLWVCLSRKFQSSRL